MDNFLLVSSFTKLTRKLTIDIEVNELENLVLAYGGTVVHSLTQRREKKAKGGYIGKGKKQEIIDILTKNKNINIIVFNDRISPRQMQEYKEIFTAINNNIEIWDKVELILEIFDKHAHTKEAKLQIKQAKLRHGGSLFRNMGHELSRQSGGIGTRGAGETNTEIEERNLKEQIRRNKKKIEKLTASRQLLIDNRKTQHFKTVSLIGYTNAGKTSLFNTLTGKDKIVNDALFVTLDSSVGALKVKSGKSNILISDTIGFINNLPPQLIEAFRSTLMESIYSDILLHVVDINDIHYIQKITMVENILKSLKIINKPRLLVFNKIDTLDKIDRNQIRGKYNQLNPQFISVHQKLGLGRLIRTINKILTK